MTDQPTPETLRDQYAAVLNAKIDGTEGCANGHRLADAVLALRDQEMEQLRARIAELDADLARVQQVACSNAENLRKANASRHTAIRRAILLSRHQGLLVAIREFVAEETTPTNGWGDGYRDAKRDLVEILDAFAPDAADEPQQPVADRRDRCICGETACESELCDCDGAICPVDHAADEAQQPEGAEAPLNP